MFTIEGVDHIVLLRVNLVLQIYVVFDELNELLHFAAEEAFYV